MKNNYTERIKTAVSKAIECEIVFHGLNISIKSIP
jgi:hypothetical protein